MSGQIMPSELGPILAKVVAPVRVRRSIECAQYELAGARVRGTLDEYPLHTAARVRHLGEMLGITIKKMRALDPFVAAYERDAEIEIHPVFTLNHLEQLAFPEN